MTDLYGLAARDDATIRRCRGFAEREGCSSFEVVNLFALVSTDSRGLLADPDPVGFACDQVIVSACTGRDDRTVVVAWAPTRGIRGCGRAPGPGAARRAPGALPGPRDHR